MEPDCHPNIIEAATPQTMEMEFEIVASSPKQFGDWIGSEIKRWGKVIKDTGAKAE